jgi:hypothetical protein
MKAETYVGYSENLFISAFVGWMSEQAHTVRCDGTSMKLISIAGNKEWPFHFIN